MGIMASERARLAMLTGYFFAGGKDRELDRVGVWVRDDKLHVAMRDNSGGDTFGYLVDFVAIPIALGLVVKTGTKRGSGMGADNVNFPLPSRRTNFLLTGWALNFKRGDHRIRDLGVDRTENGFNVIYGDKNPTSVGGSSADAFDWRVEWAHIAPRQAILS